MELEGFGEGVRVHREKGISGEEGWHGSTLRGRSSSVVSAVLRDGSLGAENDVGAVVEGNIGVRVWACFGLTP